MSQFLGNNSKGDDLFDPSDVIIKLYIKISEIWDIDYNIEIFIEILRYWLKYWDIGISRYWNNGILESWGIGIMIYLNCEILKVCMIIIIRY